MATQQILKVDLPVIDQLISSGMLRGVIRATGKRRDFILKAESVERLDESGLKVSHYLTLQNTWVSDRHKR